MIKNFIKNSSIRILQAIIYVMSLIWYQPADSHKVIRHTVCELASPNQPVEITNFELLIAQ